MDATIGSDDRNAIASRDIGEMSRVMAAIITRWPLWVHRRSETITFVGTSRIHHEVVLHVTVPLDAVDAQHLRFIPFPVGLFRKEVLTALVAKDESSALLSYLITPENRRLTTRMLWGMMATVTAVEPLKLDEDARAVAWALTGPRDVALVASPWLRDWLKSKAVPAPPASGALRGALDSLFVDLAERYYLSVLLDPAGGQDRIVQISFDEHAAPGRRRVAERETLSEVQVGLAESTHVEVEAPPGCLFTRREKPTSRSVVFASDLKARPPDEPRPAVESLGQVLSIAVRSRDATLRARIRKTFCLAPGGLVGPALLISGATAVLLIVAYVARLFTPQALIGAPSVVVALPAAYVAIALRPSEHPITRQLEKVARNAMLVAAGLSLAAAGSLEVTFPRITDYDRVPLIGSLLRQHQLGWRSVWWGLLVLIALVGTIWVAGRYRRELRGRDARPATRVSS